LKGLAISFIVGILGLSLVGFGHLSGSESDDNHNWWNNYGGKDDNWYKTFWGYFDIKKITGFMSSGGSHDDHDDEHNVDQSPIDDAKISFNVMPRKVDYKGEKYFQNVVNECIFSSMDKFKPLCVRCKILDMSGKVIGKGEVIDFKKTYNPPDKIIIPLASEPVVGPNDPAFNIVNQLSSVKLSVCAPKCDCKERKDDHKSHYDYFTKYYNDHKNTFSKSSYKNYMEDYRGYLNSNKEGFDKADFKQYTDQHKKEFDKGDWDKYDKEEKDCEKEREHHEEKCECECDEKEHKDKHKKSYDDFKSDYDTNKKYFEKGDYTHYISTFKNYFDNNKNHFNKLDFKQHTDFYRSYLDTNKKSFDKGDWDKYDKDYKNYMSEYPKHGDKTECDNDSPPPPKECKGLSLLKLQYTGKDTVMIKVYKGTSSTVYMTFPSVPKDGYITVVPSLGDTKLNDSFTFKFFKNSNGYWDPKDTIIIDITCSKIKDVGYTYTGTNGFKLTIKQIEKIMGW
jgi:hypothetical protein